MTTRTISSTQAYAGFAFLAAIIAAPAVLAQEHGHGGFAEHGASPSEGHGDAPHVHLDTRFAHNRPYSVGGYTVHAAPRSGYALDYRHRRYGYEGGQWYLAGEPGRAVV